MIERRLHFGGGGGSEKNAETKMSGLERDEVTTKTLSQFLIVELLSSIVLA